MFDVKIAVMAKKSYYTKFVTALIILFRFYFFGCIDVQANGEYIYTPAPAGTFFNGQENGQWLTMMAEHCGEQIEVPTT